MSSFFAWLWSVVQPSFESGWFDILSLLVAIGYALNQASKKKLKLISRETGLEVANGVSLFPLFMLVIAGFYGPALSAVLHSNKLILCVAGIVALLAILEETEKDPSGPSQPK